LTAPRQIELSRAALADFDTIYGSIAYGNPPAVAEMLRALDRHMRPRVVLVCACINIQEFV
jgi:plasmid stabilization system protein ParE